jgi:hypothetical protein
MFVLTVVAGPRLRLAVEKGVGFSAAGGSRGSGFIAALADGPVDPFDRAGGDVAPLAELLTTVGERCSRAGRGD